MLGFPVRIAAFMTAPGRGTPYLGLNLTPTFYLNGASGVDSATGTTALTPWKTWKRAADSAYEYPSLSPVVLRAAGVPYTDILDYFAITKAVAPGNPGLIVVCEPGVIMDGTAAVVSVNQNGFEFSTGNNWPVLLYGNGGIIRNYANPYGSANGIGNRGFNILTAHDWTIENCDDGASAHADANLSLVDVIGRNCVKGAFTHVDRAVTSHIRCRFEGRPGATLGLGANQSSGRTAFEDTILIPATSGQALDLGRSDVLRCQIGALDARVNLVGTDANYDDSFFNANFDTNAVRVIRRAYGKINARMRSGGSLTLERSSFNGPASGATSMFSDFANSGVSPHLIRSNIMRSASAAAFMSYTSSTGGTANDVLIAASASQYFKNLLAGSAAMDAGLVAADPGGAVVNGNFAANPLTGSADTLNPDDYGYAPGSPAIGAGVGGVNCGFAIGEVSAPLGPRVLP